MTGVGLSIMAMAILASEPQPAQPLGRVFSDVCVERGSGDARGHQVIVESLGPHPRIWLSWSEGGLVAPVLASTATFEPHSKALSFDAPAPGGVAHFAGRLEPTALTGRLRDYWRKTASKVRLPLAISDARSPCGES
jgi:hypothetical protein